MMTNELAIRQDLTPGNWDMLKDIATFTAASASQESEKGKKLLFCFENNLPLSLAVIDNSGLFFVNGRMGVEGVIIRAQIIKHPHYSFKIIRLDNTGCEMEFYNDDVLLGAASFTEEDAKLADLLDKDNYKKYPSDMYINRATSRGYKWYLSDIFMQALYVRGEIDPNQDAIIDGELVQKPTLEELNNKYGTDAVLEAMNQTAGDIDAVVEWLQNNEVYDA